MVLGEIQFFLKKISQNGRVPDLRGGCGAKPRIPTYMRLGDNRGVNPPLQAHLPHHQYRQGNKKGGLVHILAKVIKLLSLKTKLMWETTSAQTKIVIYPVLLKLRTFAWCKHNKYYWKGCIHKKRQKVSRYLCGSLLLTVLLVMVLWEPPRDLLEAPVKWASKSIEMPRTFFHQTAFSCHCKTLFYYIPYDRFMNQTNVWFPWFSSLPF